MVIGNHRGVIANAHALGHRLELVGGHHVLAVGVRVFGPIVGNDHGAGDVSPLPGVIVIAVQDDHVEVIEVRGDPFRVGQIFGVSVSVGGDGHAVAPAIGCRIVGVRRPPGQRRGLLFANHLLRHFHHFRRNLVNLVNFPAVR